MSRYRKKPVEVEVVRWWKNGDHPDDHVGEQAIDPGTGDAYTRVEGQVVRFYRHPEIGGEFLHCGLLNTARPNCFYTMDDHGWIDTLEGGHTVCPGDYIITGVAGERYPCEPSIFEATYEEADDEG